MKQPASINENNLDGALNALFLEKYSREEDESLARFILDRNYDVVPDTKKEAAMLARLTRTQGGSNNLLLLLLGLLLIIATTIFLFKGKNDTPQEHTVNTLPMNTASAKPVEAAENHPSVSVEDKTETKEPKTTADVGMPSPIIEPLQTNDQTNEPSPVGYTPEVKNEPVQEKELPYFNKEGLSYFASVKERMIQKLLKIDDFLYCKTEPGATYYKSREVIIAPFVMSNFPVTNQQYKVFLADLAMQGRVDDMKKCLPKTEIWKEYGCIVLSKNYFEKESYNDFPVVNITKEASVLFCEWLEVEMNEQLNARPSKSKFKSSSDREDKQKKQVTVRLPYDYEWIYSADAAYTLIPNCGGYNTIYDATEGLVDKNFYNRTSQLSKRDLRKENRMDKLNDVNRWGMTETEILAIFKEAQDQAKTTLDPLDPNSYPNNIEACCLAGHVCELIKNKDEGMTVRGCCWKSKEDYQKMMSDYKKYGASPFIGFRVMIMNTERGSDKNPFW